MSFLKAQLIGLFMLSSPLLARAYPECDPTYLRQQDLRTRETMARDARLGEMEILLMEFQSLKNIGTQHLEVPKSFIERCLKEKEKTFLAHTTKADSSAAHTNRFEVLCAKFQEERNDSRAALLHYAAATRFDPKDWESQQRGFRLFKRLELDPLIQKIQNGESPREREELFRKARTQSTLLLQNPQTPKTAKVEIHAFWAQVLSVEGKEAEAMEEWKKLLLLDPKHLGALRKLAQFEFSRNRFSEARSYLEVLVAQKIREQDIYLKLLDIQLNSGAFQEALLSSREALTLFPQSLELKASLAAALFGVERVDEARQLNNEVLAKNPKIPRARSTASQWFEKEGDRWSHEKLFGKALAEYSESLKWDKKNPSLRLKMATLIYNFRRADNFPQDEASRKDMDQVLDLLESEIVKEGVTAAQIEIYISAAPHSTHPSRGTRACDEYKKIFGRMGSWGLLKNCVGAYRKAQRPSEALTLIQKSEKDPRFQGAALEKLKLEASN